MSARKFAIGTRHFPQDVLCCKQSRARSSVDRASGSGPEGRGFKSLRAHFICLLWSKGLRLIILPIVLFSAQISLPSVPSISKTTSISALFAPDFLRLVFNWLSRSAGSVNSATVGAEFSNPSLLTEIYKMTDFERPGTNFYPRSQLL